MKYVLSLVAALILCATPAAAGGLFGLEGAWHGEGVLATGVRAPLERGRCQVRLKPDPDEFHITGSCAVAAGMSEISMRVLRAEAGRVLAGAWTAATGETVQFAGQESGDGIEMRSTVPLDVDGTPYEAHVSVEMQHGSFVIRQSVRPQGGENWRLVAEMTYRRAE